MAANNSKYYNDLFHENKPPAFTGTRKDNSDVFSSFDVVVPASICVFLL